MECITRQVTFERVRDVKLPKYSSDGAAGIDFFVPDDIEWENFVIWPGCSVNIPSGIKIELPQDIALIALNKSGKGSQGLNCGAVLCDPDYRGEIHLNVFNTSNKNVTIKRGEKLIQFIAIPYYKLTLHEGRINTTKRGEQGFGSTGTH